MPVAFVNSFWLEKDMMDMQPWKKLLLESWKLYFAAVYLILATIGLRKIACRLYAVYSYFHEESLRRQAGQIALSILQTAALLLIWYFIISHISLPQQCIPPDRFLDLGFYLEKSKGAIYLCTDVPEFVFKVYENSGNAGFYRI